MLHNLQKISIGLGAMLLMFSCSKDMEEVSPSFNAGSSSTDAAKVASTAHPLSVSALSTTDGKTWTFTVQKTADGNVPNIGSLMLTLTGCDDTQIALSGDNVVAATVTGAGEQVLEPSFNEGRGTACNMSAVSGYLRLSDFDEKITDGNVYTFSFTLNSAIQVKSANIWTRMGNACYQSAVAGPGCELDMCGEGQGYFHKSENWGDIASIFIGGHMYTAAEAVTLITSDKKEGGADNKGGIADSKAAFAQGVTVLLNRQLGLISPAAYNTEMAEIEAYLSTLNKLTTYDPGNLPTGNAAAKAAAGYIGDNIDCEDAE